MGVQPTPSLPPLGTRGKRSSSRALQGSGHGCVHHPQQEDGRGEVHEHRAECVLSLLTPSLRVFRGLRKGNVPGYLGFLQCLRTFHQLTACEQAEMIV